MANGNGNGGMNWIWRGFVLAVLVSMTGYIWAQQDKKIDDLKASDTAQVGDIKKNSDSVSAMKTDIATIKTDQAAMKEDVSEIRDELKEQRQDMKKILEAVQRKPGP